GKCDPLTIRYDYWIEEPYSHSPLTPGPSPAMGEGCVAGLEGGLLRRASRQAIA
ncbi:MAG: hypothetical protein RLY70_3189, partial [Planctomycetota bacterium]